MINRMDRQQQDWMDVAIEDAFRTAPLSSPPPLLYAAAMSRVRRQPQPRFRVGWLDLALSLFASLMIATVWLAWLAIPANWQDYLRMLALWNLEKLWYLDANLIAWCALAVVALLVCGAIAVWGLRFELLRLSE